LLGLDDPQLGVFGGREATAVLALEFVVAVVATLRAGSCRLHRTLSIRVAFHGQITSNARTSPRRRARAGPATPFTSSSRKQAAPSTPPARAVGQCVLSAADRTL